MAKKSIDGIKSVLFPAVVFVFLLLAWEASVKLFGVNKITLPAPTKILEAMLLSHSYLLQNLWVTALESVLGFAIGAIFAFGLATLFVYSKDAKNSLYPFAIALKATPLVAIAPLIVLWLGNSMLPMIAMSALIAFFPILVNCVDALELVGREKIELFKTFGATKMSEFFKLRFPTAMPMVFSSLKIASTLAVVGAIIGEFTGSGAGIGFAIINASYYFDTPLMFAAIALAALFGIAFFGAIALLEKNVRFFQKLTAI